MEEEDRYWEKRVARVMAQKKHWKLKWDDDELAVFPRRRLRSSA